ncbi:MAG: hypothetical protein [Sanya fiers-like virus 15]|nr:MAG: hypothetical protein [Sanya fiers-like virus 15]UUW21274.1 MAG: hypothetical protein [Sanya fiers-like virus 15]UUW21277.1 MAG: hypothetical protein [Sanya fiers-like virus 15]UUW21280.1 MAG: hypothetical protein [Sanya fiers-like virus 15]UUW21283.1 MAG: hypothetical protein [Sanya fiers-like virus 15]
MSAIANVILADGQSTPANHTFVPVNPQQGTVPAKWNEKTASTLQGYLPLTLRVTKMSQDTRVTARLEVPILASIPSNCCDPTNVPKVAYTVLGEVTFRLPDVATLQDRKNILAYIKNFLATSVAVNAVENLETVW